MILPHIEAYERHMRSDRWAAFRRDLFKVRGGARCYCCNRHHSVRRPLEAHHVTYQNFGHERPGEVVLICRVCHLMVHEWLWKMPVREATERVKQARQGPQRQPKPKGFARPRPFDPDIRTKRASRVERRNALSEEQPMTFGQEQSLR